MTKLALAIACLLVLAGPAAAQQPDITGQWEVTVTMAGQGPMSPAPLLLKKDGEKLVGSLSRPQGELPVEAVMKEKAVTLSFTVPTQDGPLAVTMIGTAAGDAGRPATSMSGTFDLGARGQGQWTASRSTAPSTATSSKTGQSQGVDVTGSWAFVVEFGGGSGTPTMTFKQDGEKLTGRYVGQLGEAPLTGTVKGNAIDFTINVTFDGNALSLNYTGTVENNSMKGSAKLGDMGEATFTATKKP
jgi:hypothetical protein